MSRRVDQIENVFLSVFRLINRADSLGFDRDSPLSLQIHVIQYLCLHLAARQKTRLLYDAIRQRGFAVVNMCNNAKISDFTLIHPFHLNIKLFVHLYSINVQVEYCKRFV